MWHEWVGDPEVMFALGRKELPAGVDPESSLGKHYREVIETTEREIAAAPPLSDAVVAAIVPLLRQGGFGRE